jgi:hypothetical protein
MPKRRPAQKFFWLLFFFVLFLSFVDSALTPVSAQEASPTTTPLNVPEIPTVGPISISYPIHGQVLKGTVNITGTISIEGWTAFELAFALGDGSSIGDNATLNWFVFASGINPLPDGPLATWDTTALTDGDYTLRLRVFSSSGDQDILIYGLRVRNYLIDTPLPTMTFTPTTTPPASPTVTPTVTFTPLPTATPYSMPTPMPSNPAILRTDQIIFNLGRGVLFTGLLFGVFGLFLRLRRR